MDKKRIELIITAVLAVIFIFAWSNALKVLKKKSAVSPQPAKGLISEKEVYPQKSEEKLASEDLQWVRDPFSGKIYSHQGLGVELSLTGILWDPKKPQALINDKICNIGDLVNGCQVLEIQKAKVILNDGSKQIELKL